MRHWHALVLLAAAMAASGTQAQEGTAKTCSGYALSLPSVAGKSGAPAGAEPAGAGSDLVALDVLEINDSPMSYCGYESSESVARKNSETPVPELSLEVSVERLPKAYRSNTQARRDVAEFLLLRELGSYAMWPSLYTISDTWTPPHANLPLLCRSVAWEPGTEDGAGDETISCVLVDSDRILRVSAGLVATARSRRDGLIASLASLHRDEGKGQ